MKGLSHEAKQLTQPDGDAEPRVRSSTREGWVRGSPNKAFVQTRRASTLA
jgi:hypothetical protein